MVPGIVSRFVIVIRLHPAKRGLYSRALCPPPPCPQPSPATLLTPFLTLHPRLVSRSCRQSHVRTGCIESGLLLKRRHIREIEESTRLYGLSFSVLFTRLISLLL